MFINTALATTDTMVIEEASVDPNNQTSLFSSSFTTVVPMVLIFAVFYFLLIRPQERKRKEQNSLIAGVKKGEEIVTKDGIYGVVSDIHKDKNTIMLRVADGVEIKMLKIAIVDIVSRKKDQVNNKNNTKKKIK